MKTIVKLTEEEEEVLTQVLWYDGFPLQEKIKLLKIFTKLGIEFSKEDKEVILEDGF